MHRETGYFVVDRPIGYALTAAGEGVALAVQARAERETARNAVNGVDAVCGEPVSGDSARRCQRPPGHEGRHWCQAAAPLGRSPAVLPSQKQAAASEPTARPLPDCTASAECACRECKAERCARCRLLLQELSAAVHAFSAENGPFVRAYAHLTYQQVHEGKKRLEALGKNVRVAQNRFREHTRDHH